LAGENNLSDESYQKLEAIRERWKASGNSRILIYQDALDISPRLLEITDSNSINIVEEYETENSADPNVFHRVINQSKLLVQKVII
jgi:hypothetical protein